MSDARKATTRSRRAPARWLPAALLAVAGGLVPLGTTTAGAAPRAAATGGGDPVTMFVATTGADTGGCQSSPCKSLGYALTQARPNDRIVILPGTYAESTGSPNVVGPSLQGLTIRGAGSAAGTIIDATGNPNGIVVEASDVSVIGLTVENANLEGILAEPAPSTWPTTTRPTAAGISHVTIADNIVENNDRSYVAATPPLANPCPKSSTDTDDCGEGIHLLGVSSSSVIGNTVTNNVGGILVTDGGLPTSSTTPGHTVGPAAHNLIAFNNASNNKYDCGITLPGHDPQAVATSGSSVGQPQPTVAGVYDNEVAYNVADNNGGAGMLDATPLPGTGSYDNTFYGNFASGNGLAGFVLHSHAPLQDVSGIRVIANQIGTNNTAGDPDTGVKATTGVMLLSIAVTPTVQVNGNTISQNTNGIAANAHVTVAGHNTFSGVTNALFEYTPPRTGS